MVNFRTDTAFFWYPVLIEYLMKCNHVAVFADAPNFLRHYNVIKYSNADVNRVLKMGKILAIMEINIAVVCNVSAGSAFMYVYMKYRSSLNCLLKHLVYSYTSISAH